MNEKQQKYEHLRYGRFTHGNAQHYRLLSLCREIGWLTMNPKTIQLVPDIQRLGAWLKKYGHLHKPLQQYDRADLSILITQFEKVVDHHLSSPKPCQNKSEN